MRNRKLITPLIFCFAFAIVTGGGMLFRGLFPKKTPQNKAFWQKLPIYRKTTQVLQFTPGDPGQVPVTKLGGIPWWPRGLKRSTCPDGHPMSFVCQYLLTNEPSLQINKPTLISFHYCIECAWAGKMSWGYQDSGLYDGTDDGYALHVFENPADTPVDGKGIVGVKIADAATATLQKHDDYPGVEDIALIPVLAPFCPSWKSHEMEGLGLIFPEDISALEKRTQFIIHPGAKIGGWPSWVQSPEWPEIDGKTRLTFSFQLPGMNADESPWVDGYAYIFLYRASGGKLKGTLVLQMT